MQNYTALHVQKNKKETLTLLITRHIILFVQPRIMSELCHSKRYILFEALPQTPL
nr:MAG TPA: hypothetical protein [Caudoviricetes sp.]